MSATEEQVSYPWPNEFSDIQNGVKDSWRYTTINLHRQLAGKSGAYVYLVYVALEDYKGNAILKLERRSSWQNLPVEAEQLKRARANSGDFGDQHLPGLLREYYEGDVAVYLFNIAADGLEYVFPLGNIDGNSDSVLESVCNDLANWSALNHKVLQDPMSAAGLLSIWLEYRIKPEEGGRLHDFVKMCGLAGSEHSFSTAGTVYPNPLAFCLSSAGAADLYPIIGQQHGDCHGNNILIKLNHAMDVPFCFMIDFALYQESWPIFYDPAYLELSLMLELMPEATVSRWDAFLTYCGSYVNRADQKKLKIQDKNYSILVRNIRAPFQKWVSSNHRSVMASADGQIILARVAAGLNFANKSTLELNLRYKALLYAAHQLKEYFIFKKMELPDSGSPLKEPFSQTEIQNPTSEAHEEGDWRLVSSGCQDFSSDQINILVIGAGLNTGNGSYSAIGTLPWSAVLDFNPDSTTNGVLSVAKDELQKQRGFHELDVEPIVEINFDRAALWLMARGASNRPDTVFNDFTSWRNRNLRKIDKQIEKLYSKVSPKKICVLVLFADESDRDYFSKTLERILEVVSPEAAKVIVSHEPHLSPIGLEEKYENIPCSPDNWISGVARYLGAVSDLAAIFLPVRIQEGNSPSLKRNLRSFSQAELLNIDEDLEILHPGLENTPGDGNLGDFLRGNTITWAELGKGYDVELEMYSEFRKEVLKKLEAYTNETIELGHEPGAGGSTVARRLAWSLHREFPCVILRNFSSSTADRVAQLYQMTHLPVLVIIEANILSVAERERLFKSVAVLNVRAVFVYVKRRYNFQTKFRVCSPLTRLESGLFLAKYHQENAARQAKVEKLASSDALLPYRIPFFFGLYAFEENFTHINSYVSIHIKDISDRSKILLRYLALVSCYTQASLDLSILAVIADRAESELYKIEDVFCENALKLIVQDSSSGRKMVRIVHPLIAESIISLSGGGEVAAGDMASQLESLSCSFIDALSEKCPIDAEIVLKLLDQLFIRREQVQDEGGRAQFSQLISSIVSVHGQGNVLKKLTESYPDMAHFWNHRGRHSLFQLNESYVIAEDFLITAIQKQNADPLHHHTLGMVYRAELKRILRDLLKSSNSRPITAEQIVESIDSLYTLAEESFKEARRLDSDDEHGYVASVQMTIFIIENMRLITKSPNYSSLFTASGNSSSWLRSQLEHAKDLLDHVGRIQGQSKSEYVSTCLSKYRGLFGDYESMFNGLNALLKKSSGKPCLRRLIVDCIRNEHIDKWSSLKAKNLIRIRDLAMDNINEGSATSRDYISWFQAYRRLPSFSLGEAISVMDKWSLQGDPLGAHYYLYILHFLKWHGGLTTDLTTMKRHLSTVTRMVYGKTWSYEWLSNADESNCGLVQDNELGEFVSVGGGQKFFENSELLLRVTGVISNIKDARSGSIAIFGSQQGGITPQRVDAFFVPGTDFIKGRDENRVITAYIGFSYAGLRAWSVKLN